MISVHVEHDTLKYLHNKIFDIYNQTDIGWDGTSPNLLYIIKITKMNHSTCKVLNFWLLSVEYWIIEKFVCYTLKFAYSFTKTDRFVFYSG